MDYEEMSDLEINKLVAKEVSLLVKDESDRGYDYNYREKYPSTIWTAKHEFGNQTEAWEQMNFCLTPDDAWHIILENNISISISDGYNDNGEKEKDCAAYTGPQWKYYEHGKYRIFDTNPLRAAMIVFLMIKEKEE